MYPFAMETSINITRTERVDDIPLLLAQMEKMNMAALLDKHFPMHGNWQGLSLGIANGLRRAGFGGGWV